LSRTLTKPEKTGFLDPALADRLRKMASFRNLAVDEYASLDPRIVNQFGLFSFMNRPDARLDEWLGRDVNQVPTLAKKIVIPVALKWEVRDKLDQMNMTERVMMPGLDGLCTWLKRWYSPKNPAGTTVPPAAALGRGRPGKSARRRGGQR
jgi:hypothetical protein